MVEKQIKKKKYLWLVIPALLSTLQLGFGALELMDGVNFYINLTSARNLLKNYHTERFIFLDETNYVFYMNEIYSPKKINNFFDGIKRFRFEYFSSKSLIYSFYEMNNYNYYLVDENGNEKLLLDKVHEKPRNLGYDGKMLYYTKKYDEITYYSYDTETDQENIITCYDYYEYAYKTKYVCNKENGLFYITDLSSNFSKQITLESLQKNSDINKILQKRQSFFFKNLTIFDVCSFNDKIYCVLHLSASDVFVVETDFEFDSVDIIATVTDCEVESLFKMFYLNINKCEPLDLLLSRNK